MSKLIVTMWMSVDGYVSDRSGGLEWIKSDDRMSKYELDLVGDAGGLLFGKTTYNEFSSYWPSVPNNPKAVPFEKEFSTKINSLKKWVVSHNLPEAAWDNTEIVRDLNKKTLTKIKKTDKNVMIYGSVGIVQQLTSLGAVDEYQLLVHPLILGGGKRLFDNIDEQTELSLKASEKFASGVQLLVYSAT